MSLIRIAIALSIGLTLISCNDKIKGDDLGGDNVTAEFMDTFSGNFREKVEGSEIGEEVLIDSEGTITVRRVRQVGEANNPAIPQNTVCGFSYEGRIHYVVELRDDRRERSTEEGTTFLDPATHALTYSVLNAKLDDAMQAGSSSDQSCRNFIEKQNQDLPTFTLYMELFAPNTIRFHTHGGGDYKGFERTAGTLDEVFERF